MKLSRLLFVPIILACALLIPAFVAPVMAATGAVKTIKLPPPVDKRILIKSVDLKAGTITIMYMRSAKAPVHVYKIDDMTTLTVMNQKGTITDVKAGMQVRDFVERDNDTLDSASIDHADPAPVDPNKK